MPLDDAARRRAAETKVRRTTERVLRTTNELMDSRGMFAVSVRLVSQESGVSEATIYRLFETRENLLSQAFLRRSEAATTTEERTHR